MKQQTPLLEIVNLSVQANKIPLLSNINLQVYSNEILALVGESGSGKSLLAKCIMRLLPSKAISITSGSIFFLSQSLLSSTESHLQSLRGKALSYIPQSPFTALNPIMSIGRQLLEAHRTNYTNAWQAKDTACSLLAKVGFHNPNAIFSSFPHQLSGGMRQRVLIAMALINSPKLLLADEPTTALDVTLQAEIIDLLMDLKEEYGLGIVFITHDLSLVANATSRTIILKKGEIVENGSTEDIFFNPKHFYTKHLLNAIIPHPIAPRIV